MKRILIAAITLLSAYSIASAGQVYDVRENTTTLKALERLVGEFRVLYGTKTTDGYALKITSNGVVFTSGTITSYAGFVGARSSFTAVVSSSYSATSSTDTMTFWNSIWLPVSTVTAKNIDTSSFTWRNIPYNPPSADGTSGQALITNGSKGLSWGSVAGGVSVPTQTWTFKVASSFVSTITVCGVPLACHNWEPSTITVIAIWAKAYSGSTVGWTRVDLIESTGGIRGLPLAALRFPPMSISTGSANGRSSWSGRIDTGVVVEAGKWLGVAMSSIPASGLLPYGIEIGVDYFEWPRY